MFKLILLLGLHMTANNVVPYEVDQVSPNGWYQGTDANGLHLYFTQNEVLDKKEIKVGDKVYGLFLPSLYDEGEFLGVLH